MFNNNRQQIQSYCVKDLLKLMSEKKIKLIDVPQDRVRMVKNYIVDNILSNEVYLPPLVVSVNSIDQKIDHLNEMKIIDGNARLKAFSQIQAIVESKDMSTDFDEIRQGEALRFFLNEGYIALQLVEGLSNDEYYQAYIDFNTKGKKVALSKLISYDSRNEINVICNDLLEQNPDLEKAGIDREKHYILKPYNKNFLSLMQLRKLTAIFLLCDLKSDLPKGPIKNSLSLEENISLINEWFQYLFDFQPPEVIGDYNKTMLASYPLLLAIAYYSIKGTKSYTFDVRKKELKKRMEVLRNIDFSPDHTQWELFEGKRKNKYYFLNSNKRDILTIQKWLSDLSRRENKKE